jgi:hypothetical protein
VVKKLIALWMVATATLVASCGGSGTIAGGGSGGTGQVAVVQLIASSTTLNSDASGNTSVQITAVVKDSGNAIIEDVPVSFQTSSGSITVTRPTTDETGTAVATLTNGLDPSNRTITVSATAGGVTGSVTVTVQGTAIAISGPGSLTLAGSGDYQIALTDAQGVGIPGRVVAVTSATGNTLSSGSLTTNASGLTSVTVTATAAANDTLTASALGVTANQAITISSDVFALTITDPDTSDPIQIGETLTVTLTRTSGGSGVAGRTIQFASTRGTLSASSAVTNGAGVATVTLSSTSAGSTTVTATDAGDATSTSQTFNFIAITPATLELQASPITVGTGGQSTLTALVRDATNNVVANQTVNFSILADSSSGGSLSVASAVTDATGRATAVYTGGTTPTAPGGVQIQAQVQATAVLDTVNLTVAGRAIDMSIGTGEDLNELTQSLYSKEWAIIVTDTTGTAPTPVANQVLQASIRSVSYNKGEMTLQDDGTGDLDWSPFPYAATCPDEDTNRDGFLSPAEDFNGNGSLEAGNRATLAGLPPGAAPDACDSISSFGGGTTNVQTDQNGIARVCVVYPKSDNLWTRVELQSQLTVFGTEFTETQQFTLEALAEDLDDENSAPAGQFSPFGQAADCASPD